jgi:hypothetical protein
MLLSYAVRKAVALRRVAEMMCRSSCARTGDKMATEQGSYIASH